ncbi:MAG: CHAD domain-containing protein [Brevundimonas sp.]|jgi:triphosphatase
MPNRKSGDLRRVRPSSRLIDMSIMIETELKLDLDGLSVSDARTLLMSRYGLPLDERRLVSTYFDTDDRRLWQAGVTLRIREDGSRRLQTLKVERSGGNGLFKRPEIEREVHDDIPLLDASMLTLGGGLLGADIVGAPLRAQFTTDINRQRWRILEGNAELELVFDQGAILGGGLQSAVRELEIELKSGCVAGLFDLAKALSLRLPVRVGFQSKAEREYDLTNPVSAGAVKAQGLAITDALTAAATLQTMGRACLRHYRLNEANLLQRPDAETLHQCRVALRRFKSGLSVFKPLIDDPESHAIIKRLKAAIRLFGEARNLDVLIQGTEDSDLAARLEARRRPLYDAVRSRLIAETSRDLLLDLIIWLENGYWSWKPDTAEARRQPIKPFATLRLRHCRRRLKRRGAHLSHLDAADRHAVRISAKTLRYATEVFAPLFDSAEARGEIGASLMTLERLQTALGELTDRESGVALLKQINEPGETSFPGRRKTTKAAVRAYKAVFAQRPAWA